MSDLRLMIAGPVDVDDEVLAALAEPTMPHYGGEWMDVFNRTIALLKRLFETENDMLMMPGTGSTTFEAAVASLVPAGDSICLPSNGFFGERMRHIAEACGIHPVMIKFPMGEPVDPDEVRQQLAVAVPQAQEAGRPIRALGIIHHETSTGVLNPLEAIAKVAREFDLPVLVDAVSSLGGTPLPVDAWGIDICATVPNKCLAVPPGMGLISISKRAWQMAEQNPSKHGWFLNFRTWRQYIEEWGDWHPYPTTMPTNNIVALHHKLESIFAGEGGLEAYIASFEKTASHVRAGMAEMGFALVPDPAYAAPMLSALTGPEGVNLKELQGWLVKERRIMISGGLAEQSGKIIRVGHMGRAQEPAYVDGLLGSVRDYLGR